MTSIEFKALHRKMQKRVKPKYHNAKCRCYHGHVHDSRLEANHCAVIADMVKRGEIESYERQVKLPLKVNGQLIATHYPDFVVKHKNGDLEIIESKGFPTEVWRLKMALTKLLYPKVSYTVWDR